jgi:hypothetical protein
MIEYPEFRAFLVGVVERIGSPSIFCYDRDAVIAHLAETMGEDAEEFFEYNTLGTYAGPTTPCFITFDRSLALSGGGASPFADGPGTDPGAISDGAADGDSERGTPQAGDSLWQ